MVDFVGSTESFPRLWELTVAKARSVVNPPMAVMESVSGGITLADVPNAIVEQQEKLQEYQETDVTVQKISDEPSNNFAPEANFTDKTPKNAKTNKKK